MLDRPNWRYHIKEKWMDNRSRGFLPSYLDFRVKTANGFHVVKRGRETEPNGSLTNSMEKYNPYINSHFDIGNKFRKRVSQKEVSDSTFTSYSVNDIMLRNSTFLSTSIRSWESLSKLNIAKQTYKRLEESSKILATNKNHRILMFFFNWL